MRVNCIPWMWVLYKHIQIHTYTHKHMCTHMRISGAPALPTVDLWVIFRKKTSLLIKRKTFVLLYIDAIEEKQKETKPQNNLKIPNKIESLIHEKVFPARQKPAWFIPISCKYMASVTIASSPQLKSIIKVVK